MEEILNEDEVILYLFRPGSLVDKYFHKNYFKLVIRCATEKNADFSKIAYIGGIPWEFEHSSQRQEMAKLDRWPGEP